MKYFLDNDISPCFAKMLKALHVDIVALREIYPQDVKDPDFLGDLKKVHNIDVFISHNHRQRSNPVEATLLRQSGATNLHFNPFWGKMVFWEQAKWLIKHWETIEQFSQSTPPGTCADIQQNGRCKPVNW